VPEAPIVAAPVAPAAPPPPVAPARGEVVFADIDPASFALEPLDDEDARAGLDDDSAWDDLVDDAPAFDAAMAARALLDEGETEGALAVLEGETGLAVATVRAAIHRRAGHPVRGLEALREAVAEASDSDAAYPDALLELAEGYAATGKGRLALRTLDELAAVAPDHRADEVAARRTSFGG
jgi:hypothetical protein